MTLSSVSGAALCVYDSVIRGHLVYKAIWISYAGEMLLVWKEPANTHEKRAVVIVTSEWTVVGHVPREIAEVFLSHGGKGCLFVSKRTVAPWMLICRWVLKHEGCLKTGIYGTCQSPVHWAWCNQQRSAHERANHVCYRGVTARAGSVHLM